MIDKLCKKCGRVVGKQTSRELVIAGVVFFEHVRFRCRREDGGCGAKNHWAPGRKLEPGAIAGEKTLQPVCAAVL